MEKNEGQAALPGQGESCDLDSHILGELASEIRSDRPADRMHAVSVLGRFGTGPSALEALKALTSEDEDPDVRRQARQAYEKLKSRIVTPMVEQMAVLEPDQPPKIRLERFIEYLGVPNPIYRIEAILQAVAIGDEAALPAILERLERERDEWVIATLVRAIGRLGDFTHAPIVRPYLAWSDHPRVVSNAIEAVAALDREGSAREIAAHVDSRDLRVQAAAVVALYPIEKDAARVCIQAMARSSKAARYAAAHCLAQINDAECFAILKQMVAEEHDPDMKAKLSEQLAATGRHL